jgi:hypothetical protein
MGELDLAKDLWHCDIVGELSGSCQGDARELSGRRGTGRPRSLEGYRVYRDVVVRLRIEVEARQFRLALLHFAMCCITDTPVRRCHMLNARDT